MMTTVVMLQDNKPMFEACFRFANDVEVDVEVDETGIVVVVAVVSNVVVLVLVVLVVLEGGPMSLLHLSVEQMQVTNDKSDVYDSEETQPGL